MTKEELIQGLQSLNPRWNGDFIKGKQLVNAYDLINSRFDEAEKHKQVVNYIQEEIANIKVHTSDISAARSEFRKFGVEILENILEVATRGKK